MKLLFLGAGAVGGYFGGRLVEAGVDLSFLVRPARASRLQRDGLRIVSPAGDCRLPVRAVTAESVKPEYDLVMLAPKAYDFDDALDSVAPAIGPQTRILPLLNGLAHMDVLDARFGSGRVLGGVAHIGAMLDEDGTIRHLNNAHTLTAGGRDPETRRFAAEFIELCGRARFQPVLSTDILTSLWEKWTMLATLAAITTLMRATVGEIVATRDGEALVRRLYGECLAVASASGVEVSERLRSTTLAMLTRRGSGQTASMLRDLRSGQRTEHDHVLGDLLARAEKHGLEAPLLSAAYCQLQVRAAGAGGASPTS